MTISSNNRKAGPFTGTGITGPYSFTFKVFSAADLLVVKLDTATGVETTLALTTDYTVSLNANQDTNPGGSITLVSALAVGYTMVITSDIDNLQPTDITNGGGFYPSVIEDALDRSTIQIQQLQEQMDRSIKVPITDPTTLEELTDDLIRLADSADNIDTVATNVADVNTVAWISSDVTTVADNIDSIEYFAAVYLGPKAADPTLRNDGTTLMVGDLYFNSTAKEMRVFDGANWQATGTPIPITRILDTFNGDGNETVFTLTASVTNSKATMIYISGVYQTPDTDYTATGTTLTFTTAPPSGTGNIVCLSTTPVNVGEPDTDSVSTIKIQDLAVTTDKIADDAVTFAKLQNIATDRILGRYTAGSGAVEELTLGSGLSLSGGALTLGAASTSAAGVVWLATDAEMQTGTDTARPPTVDAIRKGLIVNSSVVATTSGTYKEITGIPSWAKKITVMLSGVSTNGSSPLILQFGSGGNLETSGYTGYAVYAYASGTAWGAGAAVTGLMSAGYIFGGRIEISLMNPATGEYAVSGVTASPGTTSVTTFLAGNKTVAASTIDRIRLTTVNGTDAFDAGSFSVMYE